MTIPATLLQKCWFLAGPTASGKTAVSLELAERLHAEIVSLDSMAIYRGMDIGTAKPTLAERQRIVHHLIDVANPDQDFSVAEFLKMAVQAAEEIDARGHVPLFVGGTGLYLRSALRGLFEGPQACWELRQELQESAVRFGPVWLHNQLREIDPATAERLHPNDMRRIIRAIEVFRITGRPLSEDQTQLPRPPQERPRAVIWLNPPRDWLHQRIETRVDRMMQDGFEKETRRLLDQFPTLGRTASQGLGYRELIRFLNGHGTLADAVDQIKTGTRQFAKRQLTWFRNMEECSSLDIRGDESAGSLCDSILKSRC